MILGTRFGLKDINGQRLPNTRRDTLSQNPSLTTILAFLNAHPDHALVLLGTQPNSLAVDNICTFGGMFQRNMYAFTSLEAFAEALRNRKPTPTPSRLDGRLLVHGNPTELDVFAWAIVDAASAAGHAIETKYARESAIRSGESRVLKLQDNVLHF